MTVTLSSPTPRTRAASVRASCGFCVGAQTSQAPFATRAIAAGGSIGSCARCGTKYEASTTLAAFAKAASTSPTLRSAVPGAYLYGDAATDTYSELNSFYLLVDRPSVYGLPDNPFNPWLHMKGDYVRAAVGGLAAVAVLLTLLLLPGY